MSWSVIINIILGLAVIIQAISKIISDTKIKELKEEVIRIKEAQIRYLHDQLAAEKEKNDVKIAEMFKKRAENLKIILTEKEDEIAAMNNSLSEKIIELEGARKRAIDSVSLEAELLKIRLDKEQLENDKLMLLSFINEIPAFSPSENYLIDETSPANLPDLSYTSYLKFIRKQLIGKNERL
jgi:hypothetical protein